MNIYINDAGDFELDPTTNNLRMVDGIDEIRQIIVADLETFAGEWFLDTSIGVPWFSVLEKNVSQTTIDNLIIETITRSAGVVSLLTYESVFDKATRSITISFSAETVAGILDFSQTYAT